MAIRYVTGRTHLLKSRLIDEIGAAMQSGHHALILVVPAQYALQAELDIISSLNMPGSFRLQVLPPERLYARIFEQAGQPEAVRMGDQGRVMLMYMVIKKLEGRLKFFKSALHKKGFAERAALQVSQFKQAGLKPADVLELCKDPDAAALPDKLCDLALIYESYEAVLAGRFMDAEDEAREAVRRMRDARMLRGSEVWFYGFDLISPTLAETFIALTETARSTTLMLALENDGNARDFDVFMPVQRSFEQLHRAVLARDLKWERIRLDGPPPSSERADLEHLMRELFCWPYRKYNGEPKHIQLASPLNPQDEAEFCAAVIRHLVMTRGWRYGDFTVACQNLADYEGVISRAFALYEVPIFLSESRPADRHPLSVCLLSALRLVSQGFRGDDMEQLIRTGYMNLTTEECDLLVNYALEHGLRGKAWQNPLRRGSEEIREKLEPVREKLVAPLLALDARLRGAGDTRARLAGVYQFLEDIDARSQLLRQQAELTEEGHRIWAMEGAQVWNRIVGALDQMHDLLGGTLSTRDILALLSQALAATEVKLLPQSGDAVAGGSLHHMKSKPVRAMMLIGMSDTNPVEEEALLSDDENRVVSETANVYLSLSAVERSRLNRLSVKSLLSLAGDYMYISYPISGMDGSAAKPGALVSAIRRIMPGIVRRGGVSEDMQMRARRLNAPGAVMAHLPFLLRSNPSDEMALEALGALSGMPQYKDSVRGLKASIQHRVHSETLPANLAAQAYGGLDRVSVTRLERYAECPFRHFTQYALKPVPVLEFELTPRDSGVFYHNALERFLRENERSLSSMTPEESTAGMDAVTGALFDEIVERAIGDSAVAMSEGKRMREVARRAARTIVSHLSGSRFEPCEIEVEFGRDNAQVTINHSVLHGRIDRVDMWKSSDVRYLRVIDYKTGGKSVKLEEIYYGLQLQLIIYLFAAMKKLEGKPAGMFYFAIRDPMIKTEERDPDAVEEMREKELRMDGLILKDDQVVGAMAEDPARALKISYSKDGDMKGGDKLMEDADFDALIRRALDIANQMLAEMEQGETRIEPVEIGGKSGCAYCEYGAVCQRDPSLPGAGARRLKKMKTKDVLAALREEEV